MADVSQTRFSNAPIAASNSNYMLLNSTEARIQVCNVVSQQFFSYDEATNMYFVAGERTFGWTNEGSKIQD